jgi:hypothetical protein
MSPKQFEDAIRQKSGGNTPVQSKMFDKVTGGVTKGVMNKLIEEELRRKRMASSERQRVEMILGQMTDQRFKSNVCRPTYKRNERLNNFEETEFPPKEVYEPLGWDREPGVTTEKHYRKFYEDELENVEEIMSTPSEFDQYMLKKG